MVPEIVPSSGTGFRIQVNYNPSMHGRIFQPCVYIVTSERNGTLYIGVTSNLIQRVYQHKHEYFGGFSKEYSTKLLVYYEVHDTMNGAIEREKQIKNWRRNWKKDLIEMGNPEWRDLYDEII